MRRRTILLYKGEGRPPDPLFKYHLFFFFLVREMDSFRFWLWLLLPCLAIHFFLQLKRSKSNTRRLPPGPFPLPIIGNIFQLGNKPHRSLAELAKTHGPLMTLQLGQLTTVIVSSATMAKEVLQKNDLSFSNRQTVDASHALRHHDFSMAWLPVSAPWRTLRKISNSHLFSSNRLDANRHLRQNKVQELLSYVQRCCDAGVAVDIGQTAFDAALNLLSNTLFSMDLTVFGSNTSSDYKKVLCGLMAELGKPNYADYFPVLKKFDPQGIRYRMTIYADKMMDLFNTMIDRRLQAKKFGSVEVNDVLDVLLSIKQENGQELERSYILHLLLDLFAAGTDTTSGTLEWAMTELLQNPNKLKKAQAELKHLIDGGNQVEESNIAMLPYLQSIVKETLRLHPAVPLLLPRKVDTDVQVCGFTVPKNAQVLVNAWAIGRDASLWKNPNDFEPERFLELDIDVKGRNFELIPFGGGRRICPGLPLAIRMVSLMLGSLIHSFNWKLENENGIEKMDMDEKFGLSLQKRVPLRAIPTKI